MTLTDLSKPISTLGGIGYFPFAPGTAGSLAGLLVIAFLKPSQPFHIGLSVFFVTIGIMSSAHAEELFGTKDPGCIVIDEFAGTIVSLLFLPQGWGYLISAFILFRFFDITKPPPLRMIERNFKGGWAVMADDIGAAIYANLVLQAWRLLRLG
ncbi:MAG: phosphatidylglycerophosphatase A [Nitrospirae bacterium]|nr:phosphatidylglycerophosphatase A [Nitrospirota bacterium]